MKVWDSKEIANLIYKKLMSEEQTLTSLYNKTKSQIGFFYIDDLLPTDLAKQCFNVFPDKTEMKRLKSIRECKYVSAQMDKHDKLLEQVIYAFQDHRIVRLISDICGVNNLFADESLYAGGISLMSKDNFLNPHLDNSHDADRNRWRVLNLLYYVTPDWRMENGGNLELWVNGPKKEPVLIESKFNRLIIMSTHGMSWHSVNKVNIDGARCCLSNYYFSNAPLKASDKFHVTKYKGRPNELFNNLVLDIDASLRTVIRKIFKKGIRKNPHVYKKGNN